MTVKNYEKESNMKILITGGSGFIGTNLVEYYKQRVGIEIANIDVQQPKCESHNKYWIECDILNKEKLKKVFQNFSPEVVIHLAAKADVEGKTLEDYIGNTDGTRNVIDVIKEVDTINRVIITSTQFVNQYNGLPKNDEDYAPHTIYGQSKVIAEQITRASGISCCWTIIRPTNIWGPWHWRYPNEFWKVIAEGKYIHPHSKKPVIRSYGYVGNIVWQINRITEMEIDAVNKKVLYVGDFPVDILIWADAFSMALRGTKVKVVPAEAIYLLGLVGDLLKPIGIKFPITTSRYKSMTTSNYAPVEKTFEILGSPPFTIDQGVEQTVEWLKKYHPVLVKV